MRFIKIDSAGPVIDHLARVISTHLNKRQKVLWLVTGGSAISIASKVGEEFKKTDLTKLSVTLTDERYSSPGNKDSNWQQLLDKGFNLSSTNLHPILKGEDIESTTRSFGEILEKLFDEAEYKIGLFGMGQDGHTAALFPSHKALNEEKLYSACLDNSPKPPAKRITITAPAIRRLDEVVLFAVGQDKHSQIKKLGQEVSVEEQPAQILKSVKDLTVYNDYIGDDS